MAALSGQMHDHRGAMIPAGPKATATASLLPPLISFVLFSGVTWSLLNGPVSPTAEPAGAATPDTAGHIAPKRASHAPTPPDVRGPPLRVTVYDPALEPLKVVPWDAQTESGPEAPVREQPGDPIRLTAAEGANRGSCLTIADHHLACMTFPGLKRDTETRHEG